MNDANYNNNPELLKEIVRLNDVIKKQESLIVEQRDVIKKLNAGLVTLKNNLTGVASKLS